MAHDVVSLGGVIGGGEGVPFVTSMRQNVPANVAHKFAKAFLPKALVDLQAHIALGQRFTPNFNQALTDARGSIAAPMATVREDAA